MAWHTGLDLSTAEDSPLHGTFDWSTNVLSRHLAAYAKKNNRVFYKEDGRGYYTKEEKPQIDDFVKKDMELFLSSHHSNVPEEEYIYFNDTSLVSVYYEESTQASITIYTLEEKRAGEFRVFLKDILANRTKDNYGNAYVLASNYDGITTKKLGVAAVKFEPENYAEETKDGVAAILEDLKSPFPRGKLTVIEGEPGTGKTFLVRSLISEIPGAFFVIIPPPMIARLSDPNMIPTLLKLKSNDYSEFPGDDMPMEKPDPNAPSNPIVIVVEDADECLALRDNANMPSISSILNLTSGILGDLLDIRIIATTNAKRSDMDEALFRDGRLSYHLEVQKLSPVEATAVYRRLMKNEKAEYPHNNEPVLLASIYKLAKDHGFRPGADENFIGLKKTNKTTRAWRKRIGFGI